MDKKNQNLFYKQVLRKIGLSKILCLVIIDNWSHMITKHEILNNPIFQTYI